MRNKFLCYLSHLFFFSEFFSYSEPTISNERILLPTPNPPPPLPYTYSSLISVNCNFIPSAVQANILGASNSDLFSFPSHNHPTCPSHHLFLQNGPRPVCVSPLSLLSLSSQPSTSFTRLAAVTSYLGSLLSFLPATCSSQATSTEQPDLSS